MSHATEHASPSCIRYHIIYKTNDLALIKFLVAHSIEYLPAVRSVVGSIPHWGIFFFRVYFQIACAPDHCTEVHEQSDTSLIACLKLPRKINCNQIVTTKKKKMVLNPQLGSLRAE